VLKKDLIESLLSVMIYVLFCSQINLVLFNGGNVALMRIEGRKLFLDLAYTSFWDECLFVLA
jgi:hypothetical protein